MEQRMNDTNPIKKIECKSAFREPFNRIINFTKLWFPDLKTNKKIFGHVWREHKFYSSKECEGSNEIIIGQDKYLDREKERLGDWNVREGSSSGIWKMICSHVPRPVMRITSKNFCSSHFQLLARIPLYLSLLYGKNLGK